MPEAIEIRGLTKTFGAKVAVDQLDLTVPTGSLCGFIGPNGAGKTTTIRMIMSIIFPDSGELRVLGRASAVESKDRIGYLPEERGVYKKMKVGAFLTYIAKLKGVDSGAARRKTLAWIEKIELHKQLKDVHKKRCEELSKGMQQKVQFIAAVVHEPDLLILDEVFTGLDPVNRRLMRGLIEEQHKRGCTIVFSTHAMYEAEQLCQRVFMIHQGVKVLDDTLSGIRAKFDPRTIIVEPMDAEIGGGANAVATLGAMRSVRGIRHVEAVEDRQGAVAEYLLTMEERCSPREVIPEIARVAAVRRVELKKVSLDDVFIDLVTQGGDTSVKREDLRLAAEEAANV
ncbi:MAG: ATP-binding cassette domain-containing protein [Phycisphaerales bacterium]|nr:ATP-binding cassette domain-containing protein [Phycisphaerales bacterium]